MMESLSILERDKTGKCIGECKNLILEGMKSRQQAIMEDGFIEPDSYPSVSWAHSRNEQPGWLGGHL